MTRLQKRYVELGWNPIPVPAGEKNPNRRNWQDERTTLQDIPKLFSNGQNTGLITGEASSWLVDGDLDCQEARAVAGRFWEPTLTSGRESAPDSHWWFYSEGFGYYPFTDLDNQKKILEVSGGGGHHTLVEPSVHPCGERVVWSRSGLEPVAVEADVLLERSRKLAAAALIARHLPERRDDQKDTGGGRHDLGNAVAGFLLRRELSEDDVLLILKAAWDAYGFEGDRAAQREAHRDLEGIVRDTARKIRDGEPATGGRTLEGMVPRLPRKLADYFGWKGSVEDQEEAKPAPPEIPFPEMDPAAYRGVFGELVELISPHSEADPVAILLSAITAFGNAYGRRGYVDVSGSRHHGNLFVGIVGDTSRARKGTSWAPIENIFSAADPDWAHKRIDSGLSSGEGLISAVRDKIEVPDGEGDTKVSDPGIKDKRLLVSEGELSQGLKVLRREGNTLSPILRNAWDGRDLSTMVKHSPLKATEPNISVLGHITSEELRRQLVEAETDNGLANRFLWAAVRRSKKLPFGGELDKVDMAPAVRKIRDALSREAGRMRFADDARETWVEMYDALTEDRPGMFGKVTARAEAQTLRLAIVYALADGSDELQREHLAAAYAVWGYCEDSALYLFGDALGDADADKLLEALRASEEGMTRTEVRDLFGRNKGAAELQRVLDLLYESGKAHPTRQREGDGKKPVERWHAGEMS